MDEQNSHRRTQSLSTNLAKPENNYMRGDPMESEYSFYDSVENEGKIHNFTTAGDTQKDHKTKVTDKMAANSKKSYNGMDYKPDFVDYPYNSSEKLFSSVENREDGDAWETEIQSQPKLAMRSTSSSNVFFWDHDMSYHSDGKWQALDVHTDGFKEYLNPSGVVVQNQESSWNKSGGADFDKDHNYRGLSDSVARHKNGWDHQYQKRDCSKRNSYKTYVNAENRTLRSPQRYINSAVNKNNDAVRCNAGSSYPKSNKDVFFTKAIIKTEDQLEINDEIILSKGSPCEINLFKERFLCDGREGKRLLSDGSDVRKLMSDHTSDDPSFNNSDVILDGPVFVMSPSQHRNSSHRLRSLDHLVVLPMTSTKKDEQDGQSVSGHKTNIRYNYEPGSSTGHLTNDTDFKVDAKSLPREMQRSRKGKPDGKLTGEPPKSFKNGDFGSSARPVKAATSPSVQRFSIWDSPRNKMPEETRPTKLNPAAYPFHNKRASSRSRLPSIRFTPAPSGRIDFKTAGDINSGAVSSRNGNARLFVRNRSDYAPGSTRKRWTKYEPRNKSVRSNHKNGIQAFGPNGALLANKLVRERLEVESTYGEHSVDPHANEIQYSTSKSKLKHREQSAFEASKNNKKVKSCNVSGTSSESSGEKCRKCRSNSCCKNCSYKFTNRNRWEKKDSETVSEHSHNLICFSESGSSCTGDRKKSTMQKANARDNCSSSNGCRKIRSRNRNYDNLTWQEHGCCNPHKKVHSPDSCNFSGKCNETYAVNCSVAASCFRTLCYRKRFYEMFENSSNCNSFNTSGCPSTQAKYKCCASRCHDSVQNKSIQCENNLASLAEILLRSMNLGKRTINESFGTNNNSKNDTVKSSPSEVYETKSEETCGNQMLFKVDKYVQTSVKKRNYCTQTKSTVRNASTQVGRKLNSVNESTQCSLQTVCARTQCDEIVEHEDSRTNIPEGCLKGASVDAKSLPSDNCTNLSTQCLENRISTASILGLYQSNFLY